MKQVMACLCGLSPQDLALAGASCQSDAFKTSQNQATRTNPSRRLRNPDRRLRGNRAARGLPARLASRWSSAFGATADLAKQIENGAPFDVSAAADAEHVSNNLETKVVTSRREAARFMRVAGW
mgnify:CR=1 FL=1